MAFTLFLQFYLGFSLNIFLKSVVPPVALLPKHVLSLFNH